MKILIIISAIIAASTSSIIHFGPPLYTSTIPVPTAKLYHNQDSFGQYSYGYSGGPAIKSEHKSIDGVTRGTYSYIDADGNLQSVQYTADAEHGFRVAATNLPVAPTDDKRIAPEPVQDTPEVAQAKIDHLNAFREAEMRAAKDENELDENGMPITTSKINNNENVDISDKVEENDNNKNNDNDATNNDSDKYENSSNKENMSSDIEETPADTTRQLLSTLEYHDLRPVNIPIPATSYIHVSTPGHAYSTSIYGPNHYSYSFPRSYTSYTKGINGLQQYYSSGYWLENNGFDSHNIGSSHIIDNENQH